MELKQIDNYQVLEKIGEGGMGYVCKATDISTKKIVAIKTIKEGVNTKDEAFIRFKQEAKLLSELDNDGILKFIDYIEKEERIYIITEYLSGENLKSIIKSKAFDIDKKVEIILSIAKALDYVHSKGIIHKDIKPGNIMYLEDGSIKVLDFGVANLISYEELFSNRTTVAGSLTYMAPEQSGILKRPVDSRSDLYSLGILFYELVCGKPPYFSEDAGELLHQHIAKSPDAPVNIVSEFSPVLNSIILKLIKKDPEERYQSAFGLWEDLRTYLSLSADEKKNYNFELGKKDRVKNLNYHTRLVGRKNEISVIYEHLNECVRGAGFLTLLSGKSGTGKSRIISEIERSALEKNAVYVNVSAGKNDMNSPFYPIAEAVKKVLQFIRSKFSENKQQEIYNTLGSGLGKEGRVICKIAPELTKILGKYEEISGANGNDIDTFLNKLKDFFLLIASPSNPLILCFDNICNWDNGSIEFLKSFLNDISSKCIYIIATMSEEDSSKYDELYKISAPYVDKGMADIISLGDFNLFDTEDLIEEIFGSIYKGKDELAKKLYDSTQGNILLIIENIKTLVEEGIVYQEEMGWSAEINKLNNFKFSSSITDKIFSRLSKTDEEVLNVLKHASVLGKKFYYKNLLEIMKKTNPKLNEDEVLINLKAAEKNMFVTENLSDRSALIYTFVHDKIIDAISEKMTQTEIKKLHRNAAEIIENGEADESMVYKLAGHYLKGDSRRKAYKYNIDAGKLSLKNYALRLAVEYFANALNIIKKYGIDNNKSMQNRLELTLDIVDVNYQLGEYENNLVLLDEIKSIAKALDDKASLARILFLLGRNNSFLGHNNTALDYYKEALPVAEEISGINLQALIYASIGRVHIYEAVYDKAIEYIKKSLELFSKEESMEKLYALGMLGQSYSYLGYKTEALATVDELTAYKYTDNNMMKVWSSFYIAAILSFIGDPDKAILECKNAYELSKEAKILVLELNCLLLFGRAHFYRSSFSEAIKYLIRYINVSKQHHIVFMIFLGYYFIIECFILIGDINSARKYLKEVLEEKYTKELNSDYINQWSTRLEALFEVFSHSPDLKKANCLADKAIDISKSLGNKYKYHTCYNYMVKYLVLLEADKEAEGMEYYEKALSYFTDNDLQNIVKLSKKMRSKILSKKGIIEENDEIDTSVFSTSSFLTSSSSSEMSYQRQLKYLLRLSEQLSSFHEMDILLQKIMDFSIEASGAERGALFLYEDGEGGACVSLKIMTGIENNAGKDFEYSKKMLDKTFETKKGQLVIDAGIELSADDNYGDTNLKSIMTVPLMTKGKLLGAIYLDNKQVKGLFNEQNFELLKAFAVEAAISIENAKLYKQVEENARIEQEMAIAKDIQISILPDINDIKGYKIAGYMRTADEVGGDYYDFYLNESPYLGVFGDVSGHGLKSGLIMMMAEVSFNTIARIESMKNSALKNIYQTINNTLYENIQSRLSKKSFIGSQYSNMYMTFRLYRFNEEGDFEMFGNDHAEPFICRKKTGEIIPIPSTGFIIGIVGDALGGDDASFKFKLDEGDLLCLYSDGISEAKKAGSENTNGSLDLFSDERLHNLVSMNRNKSPQEIISQVTHEVENWMSIQHDDISIVVIKKE